MAALSADKRRKLEVWKYHLFTLTSGKVAWKGGMAVLETTTGKVLPAAAATPTCIRIGVFAEHVDATSTEKPVNVDLESQIHLEWFANDVTTPVVAATHTGSLCYALNDATVTMSATSAGLAVAGRVWAVDATKGVLVEKVTGRFSALAPQPSVWVYTANDYAPATVVNGAIYDVATTAAASTISLPVAAPDGTIIYFRADGTKNGHTVTYRDVAAAGTTALTASKTHLVVCVKLLGHWAFNAYIGP